MDAEKEGLLTDMEVTQICASRSRVLGQYHMMTGMNPVYIISAGGKEDGFGNFDHGDLQRKRENSGGVEDAVVNFMTQKMTVQFEDGREPKSVMKDVLKACKKIEPDCEIEF